MTRTPTAQDITRFHAAVMRGDMLHVQSFVADFGDSHVNDLCQHHQPPSVNALVRALWASKRDMAIYLIRHGADMDIHRPTALRQPMKIAIENNMADVVAEMLDHGWPVDHKTMFDQTGLCRAASEQSSSIVDLFLKRGADVNIPDDDATTPLLHAVKKNNAAIVKKLLAAGADIDAMNNKRQTPMGVAMENDYTTIAIMLRDERARRAQMAAANITDEAERRMQEEIRQRRERIRRHKPPRLGGR